MPQDNEIVGFTEPVAQALFDSVGIEERTFVQGKVRSPSQSGLTLYRFTLNAGWSSGVADADILEMDGTDTGTDDDVRDPLGIFSTLGVGDPGICVLQNGLYYVIQAPCP